MGWFDGQLLELRRRQWNAHRSEVTGWQSRLGLDG